MDEQQRLRTVVFCFLMSHGQDFHLSDAGSPSNSFSKYCVSDIVLGIGYRAMETKLYESLSSGVSYSQLGKAHNTKKNK